MGAATNSRGATGTETRRTLSCRTPPGVDNLREELDRAAIIDPTAFPADVVTMDSTVEFEDLATAEVEEYAITFRTAPTSSGSVYQFWPPFGTAFIGTRVGDIVKWFNAALALE